MNEIVFQAAAVIIPMIVAIVFHEISHGWVASMLGDPTAKQLGRLSPNPLRHVDPFGTVILPGLLKLSGLPVFGWAKPVPVVKQRLRNPRRDMMLVAAAGPGSNLVLALIGAIALAVLAPEIARGTTSVENLDALFRAAGPVWGFIALNLLNFILINIFLALFNLLPVPPFDGGHIVEGLLPPPLARRYAGIHRQALLVMILLLVVLPWISPRLDIVSWLVVPPVQWLTDHYLAIARAIAGV